MYGPTLIRTEIGRFSVRIDEKLELVLKKAVFLYGLVSVSQRELSRSHAPKNEISTAKSDANSLIINLCGERGIRTPGTLLEFTRFPIVPLQPLEHLSVSLL